MLEEQPRGAPPAGKRTRREDGADRHSAPVPPPHAPLRPREGGPRPSLSGGRPAAAAVSVGVPGPIRQRFSPHRGPWKGKVIRPASSRASAKPSTLLEERFDAARADHLCQNWPNTPNSPEPSPPANEANEPVRTPFPPRVPSNTCSVTLLAAPSRRNVICPVDRQK